MGSIVPAPDLAGELRRTLGELMLLPGLSGHEGPVRRAVAQRLAALGLAPATDPLGNLHLTLPGDPGRPALMFLAHMDQLGFMVRKVEADGLLRLERVGGVPERALAAQAVAIYDAATGAMVPGVIGNKSHHATAPEERYAVLPCAALGVDAGFADAAAARAAGIAVGAPVVYLPRLLDLAGGRIAGTAVDDRAGCAVLLELARRFAGGAPAGPLHLVWSVQEEFNLRGALPLVRRLAPAAVVQVDLVLACDTPDMAERGEVRLGGGPAMSLYAFHGRGTLNGLIPHPALVRLAEVAAAEAGLPLQRSVHLGALTETAYLQLEGAGLPCLDLGFPMRYSHSALEVADLGDLWQLAELLAAIAARAGAPGHALDGARAQ
jgi:putative aminopeptidase FrvX